MHFTIASAAAALLVTAGPVIAQQNGPAVRAFRYSFNDFDSKYGAVNYTKVASLDTNANCRMASEPTTLQGGIGPMLDELSLVFRGPIELQEFHVYTPAAGKRNMQRRARPSATERRHGHAHLHAHHKEARAEYAKRACGDWVTAIINGQETRFQDIWDCPGGVLPAGFSSAPPASSAAHAPAPALAPAAASAAPAAAHVPAAASPPAPNVNVAMGLPGLPSTGRYTRVAHYNAASGNSTGLVFQALNVWGSMKLGNVIGYTGTDGVSHSENPTTLAKTLIPENKEFIISSSTACSETSCGATAPNSLPHHGFAGEKVFIMKYQMPSSGSKGPKSWTSPNPDMPAIWALNTQIVNTQQYAPCSCWTTGCGELDIHEIVDVGGTIGYSCTHMGDNYAGGPSNGLARPLTGPMTLMVTVSKASNSVTVQVVDNDTVYGDTLATGTIGKLQAAGSAFQVTPGSGNMA